MMPIDDRDYRYIDMPWGTFELSEIIISPDEPITIEATQVQIGKYQQYEIKKVVVNPKKEATTVIFMDGTVEVVKKSPEDPEADIFSVVAYAVAKKVYGSNSAFKREIYDKLEFIDKDFKKALKKSTDEELVEIFTNFMKEGSKNENISST